MNVFKWLGVVVAVTVCFVVVFETGYLGIYRPSFESRGIPMLVLTTTDDSGSAFAGQVVGIREVSDKIWLVSFIDYYLGLFDEYEARVEPGENPFATKVLPRSPV